jgi:hypothetical protein
MLKSTRILSTVIWGSMMVPSLLLASGCTLLGLTCTDVGCLNRAAVSIGGLEANQLYEVNIATEDTAIKCTIDTSEGLSEDLRIRCDNAIFYFSQADSARIDVDDMPDQVAITVRQNGATIAQEDVVPEYRRSAPNGEACGPICYDAEIPVEL